MQCWPVILHNARASTPIFSTSHPTPGARTDKNKTERNNSRLPFGMKAKGILRSGLNRYYHVPRSPILVEPKENNQTIGRRLKIYPAELWPLGMRRFLLPLRPLRSTLIFKSHHDTCTAVPEQDKAAVQHQNPHFSFLITISWGSQASIGSAWSNTTLAVVMK